MRDAGPVEPRQARAQATRARLLDAAVDELLENGYAGLTTSAVAVRAGVSRGAQQNYFPRKTVLVTAAVRHLALRQLADLRAQLAGCQRGETRVQAGLDILFAQFSGRLFAVVVELALTSRNDAELAEIITVEERNISRRLQEAATVIFGDDFPASPDLAQSWATVLSTIRGLALLKLLGYPTGHVNRQWTATRRQLLDLLGSAASEP